VSYRDQAGKYFMRVLTVKSPEKVGQGPEGTNEVTYSWERLALSPLVNNLVCKTDKKE